MKRVLLVVLVVIVGAAIAQTVGFYLIYLSLLPPAPPRPASTPHWEARLQPGLTYGSPVLGPTTPLNDAVGGMWVVNAAREGIIQMNLSAMTVGINEDPFAVGNRSIRLDVAADFGEMQTPLEAAYYIVPARDWAVNGTTGPTKENGALAFFSGSDFVAADPFNHSVFFRASLPFAPTWTGEDPASAGDMLIAPAQQVIAIGVLSIPVGPYEYFWASDGNHTTIFEVTYVHAGYCPCPEPSGRVVLTVNASLSARPFVYYNQFYVDSATEYRSGPGATILLPLANQTLEILDTQPSVRAWVPLTLGGEPASAVGDIGFVQTSWPQQLLIPVRSSASTGFFVLGLEGSTRVFDHIEGEASWEPVGAPLSRNGNSIYTASYNPADNRTRFVEVNGTGAVVPQSVTSVPGRARSAFYVLETGQVFVETQDGRVVTLATRYTTSSNITPAAYPLGLPATHPFIRYAGSPGGTRFGTLLSSFELFGAWTDSASANTSLFHLAPPPQNVVSAVVVVHVGWLSVASSVPMAPVLWAVDLTEGRQTSCSARASGPRWSCPRRCA